MDIALFIPGLILLLARKYSWVLAIIVILASSYLQLALEQGGISLFPFRHNVRDTGILLYILLFLSLFLRKKIRFKLVHFKKSISLFFTFLFISSFVDLAINNYEIGDVIRNIRNWIFLTVIFIYPAFTAGTIKETLNIIVTVAAAFGALLLIQSLTGIHIIGDERIYNFQGQIISRGVKPPVYSVLSILIVYSNLLNYTKTKKWIYILILFLPIVISLKISYFVAVLIGIFLIEIKLNFLNIKKIVPATLGITIVLLGIFTYSNVFKYRFLETLGQTEVLVAAQVEGNLSYRLFHFGERFEYCMEGFQTALFGIGSVSEENFRQNIFYLGQPDSSTGKSTAQLNTGDIAWSVLILRFGLVGIFIYLIMYISIMIKFIKYRQNKIALVFASYLIMNLFFFSFANTIIANSEFFIFPLLIASKFSKFDL